MSGLGSGGQRTPEEVARILELRARALARPREEAAQPRSALDLLVFSVGRGRYAVDTQFVVDVVRFLEPTRVPCTPPMLLGLVNHRGRMLPVLDLRRLFQPAESDSAAWRHIVTVEAGEVLLGIAADATDGTIRVGEDDLMPPPDASRSASPLFRGLTPGAAAVLDVEALASDPRIVVDEEVQ